MLCTGALCPSNRITIRVQMSLSSPIRFDSQFRRLWMRYVNGLKLREIAEIEGVSRACVSDSILSAKKKIIHFLKKKSGRVKTS